MSAKIQKLEKQFCAERKDTSAQGASDIFKGISIFVNGYTSKYFDLPKHVITLFIPQAFYRCIRH